MSQVATRAKSMAARSLQTRDFALTLPVRIVTLSLVLASTTQILRLAVAQEQRAGGEIGGDAEPSGASTATYEFAEPTEEEMAVIRELVSQLRARRSQQSPEAGDPTSSPDVEPEARPAARSNGSGDRRPSNGRAIRQDRDVDPEDEEDADDDSSAGGTMFPMFPFGGTVPGALGGLGGVPGFPGFGATGGFGGIGGLGGGFAVPTLGLLGTEDCREDVGAVQGSCAAAFGLSVPCCDALEAAVANGCWCPPFPGGALLGGFLEVSDEAVQSLYDDLELQCGRTFDWPGEDDC